ncbi:MAG: YceI family protein, partial [Fimbriimonadaceae bacterium]|nr:YceI family protein [Fimbriimonadaceae bacterium]
RSILAAGSAGLTLFLGVAPAVFTSAPAAVESAPAVRMEKGTWSIDRAHSMVSFEVGHMGVSLVNGRFEDFSGTVTVDPTNITGGSLSFTAKAASVSTGIGARDNHLRSGDFFDVEKHPDITYVSTSVESKGNGLYIANGNLTLKGVTKPLAIPFRATKPVADQRAGQRMGFTCEPVTIKRSDFGMDYGVAAGAISDQVTLRLSAAVVPARTP